MIKGKRSQGDIIATLLIVLLVIAAGSILLRFLLPYVGSWLSKGDCFQFNGKIEIINDPAYTCYDKNTNSLYLKVGFGDFDDSSKNKVTGLMLLTQTENNMMTYQLIPPNSNPPGVSLLTGDIGQLPMKNQERTYKIMNITIKPNSTIIYPLIDKKRKCSETSDTMNFIPICGTGFMGVNTSLFISGGDIPAGFSGPITVTNIPLGTQKLAVIVEDINDTTHLVAYNLPASTSINLGALAGYIPPNKPTLIPPATKLTHYYTFTVYALNNTISPAGPTKQQVLAAMNNVNIKVLGRATLYGKITNP